MILRCVPKILKIMKFKEYDRNKAIEYAKKWAYSRNPMYYNFDNLGGDCTNFVSQCIYEGSKVMNYKKNTGWYYNSINDRAPAWSGVEFLYNFLINNKGIGPRAKSADIKDMEVGDIIQLNFDGQQFTHTLIIVNIKQDLKLENIYTASHTYDSYNRRISSYKVKDIRLLHIENVAIW